MLGDSIRAALPRLRSQAESLMSDSCVIREPDSWAGEARTEGPVAWTHNGHVEIPCRIKTEDRQSVTVTVGGEVRQQLRLKVSLPLDVCPTKDQVITVLTSADDPSLVGRRFDVDVAVVGSQITARRVWCLEHDARIQRD